MTTADRTKSRVTAADVARVAGVSRATVSHILNGRLAKFPAATQATVLEASRALGYRPSAAGRALRNGRSDIVVVVLPNATIGSSFQDGIDYVAAQVEPLGASVLTRFAGRTSGSTLEAVLYIQPIAVVDFGGLVNGERHELENAGVIVVPSSRTRKLWKGPLPDQAIGEVQVEALTSRRSRSIVYADLKETRDDSPTSRARRLGVEEACQRRSIAAPETVMIPLSLTGAVEALRAIVGNGPVGIACYNDDVATAVVAGCKALNQRIPDDVSIIGVDNTLLGQLVDPPLSTVVINVEGEVTQSLDELKARLRGEEWTPEALPDAVTPRLRGTT